MFNFEMLSIPMKIVIGRVCARGGGGYKVVGGTAVAVRCRAGRLS